MNNYNVAHPDTNVLISGHILDLIQGLKIIPVDSISKIISLLEKTRLKHKTVYLIGNGGSATTALHMASDLANLKFKDQLFIKTNCLISNISIISAIANDFGYEHVFSNQLLPVLEKEDVVIGISASGNSENCINAFKLAKDRGAYTIGMLGFSGGELLKLSDLAVHIPINDYYLVESLHLSISHAIAYIFKVCYLHIKKVS